MAADVIWAVGAACTVATVAHPWSQAQTFFTEVGVPGAPSVTTVWQTSLGVPFAVGVAACRVGDLARTGVWKRRVGGQAAAGIVLCGEREGAGIGEAWRRL